MPGPAADHRIDDPFAFAQSAGRHQGQILVATLVRLQDRLAGNAGTVFYRLRGGCDARRRPLLDLDITGALGLRCDRCLAEFEFPLRLRSRVLLAQPGGLAEDEDDPAAPEWIEAGRELDVLELIEDEILLGLPLSVRHAQGKCNGSAAGTAQAGTADSPFANLAGLLGSAPKKTR